jgi:predicted phage terminase large subunit-like protein
MFDNAIKVKSGFDSGRSGNQPSAMLMFAWQERLTFHDLVQKVAKTCKDMKVDKLLIENKAAGHSVAQEIRRAYGHESFVVQLYDPKSQDKLARLYSVQHLFAEGMIFAPDKTWADMVIKQVSNFPKGKHDDLVDTASQCLRHLRDLGLLTRSVEWTSQVNQSMEHKGKPPPPLYEV